MPQEPAALLSNASPPASRGFKSAAPTVEGEGGRDSRFGEALRESQAVLKETAAGSFTTGSDSSVLNESLPRTGKGLPLEAVMVSVMDPEPPADSRLPDARTELSEVAPPGVADELLMEGDEAPLQMTGDAQEPQEGREAVVSLDLPAPAPEPAPEPAPPVAPAPPRVENSRFAGTAGSQEVMAAVPLESRPVDIPAANRSRPVVDEGGGLLREQLMAGREVMAGNAGRMSNFSEELTARVAAEAAGRFVNVSAMAVADGGQQVSPLSSPQPAIQSPNDKGMVTTTLPLQAPLQSREWKEEFGDRVRWLITQKVHTAELKINPPQLGAVEIRINVQNEQVSVQFQTAHAMVKDSLEDSLPRLREILNSSGLDLVDVDVSQHSQTSGREADNELEDENGDAVNERLLSQGGADEAPLETDAILRQGMVDMYA